MTKHTQIKLAPVSTAWETLSSEELHEKLHTTIKGLNNKEAQSRLSILGRNKLPRERPPKLYYIFIKQFQSPLIYILLIAAVVSLFLSDYTDSFFIALVLILNAIVGSYQEWKAVKGVFALQKILPLKATVIRDGVTSEVDAEELVTGDLVWIESGNLIPADIRLTMSNALETDESLLTGESIPVLKNSALVGENRINVADRLNMVHAGTVVTRGRGEGFVVATGINTEFGKIAKDLLQIQGAKPPLQIRLEKFVNVLGYKILAAILLLSLFGVLAGHSIKEMFFAGVALAVSVIPEGLPVALTVALAVATSRMVRKKVIVRKLSAVEGLGSCTLIISDKTGTLTCNELTAKEIILPGGERIFITGEGFSPEGELSFEGEKIEENDVPGAEDLIKCGIMTNEGTFHKLDEGYSFRGDPADIALLVLGLKQGITKELTLQEEPEVASIPFEPENKYSASFHKANSGIKVYVKGAPEKIFDLSGLTEEENRRYSQITTKMAHQGFRVLAFAEGIVAEFKQTKPEIPSNLKFIGLVGLIDPLRPGVKEAVKMAKDAGVGTVIVTGDHPATALSIAKELGLANNIDDVVTGDEITHASKDKLKELLKCKHIFARTTPHQKLKLVEAARDSGHFVAVTGDGVNDAPALRVANVGISMGKSGTDVARQASELVLSEDNYANIVDGIEEGRVAYDNIRKVIFLLVATGVTEFFLIFLSILFGLPIPLTPIQLLWLNLVTNGIQDIALAMEPNEGDLLKRPPRSTKEKILNKLMLTRTLWVASIASIIGFAIFKYALDQGWSLFSARNLVLLYIVLFENIFIGSCRSESKSIFKLSPLRSPLLLTVVVVAQLVHVLSMYFPLAQKIIEVEPVSVKTWIILLMLNIPVVLFMEIHKRIKLKNINDGRTK